MNIFYTNTDPIKAAREHCRKHRNKMIIEYAQMLSSAHRVLEGRECTVVVSKGGEYKIRKWLLHSSDVLGTEIHESGNPILLTNVIYANTHVNHPSAKWARKTVTHYCWLHKCAMELTDMYYRERGKHHATRKVLAALRNPPLSMICDQWVDFSPPPLATTDEFKMIGILQGTEYGYRAYMNAKFQEWSQRDKPIPVDFDYGSPEWLENV